MLKDDETYHITFEVCSKLLLHYSIMAIQSMMAQLHVYKMGHRQIFSQTYKSKFCSTNSYSVLIISFDKFN